MADEPEAGEGRIKKRINYKAMHETGDTKEKPADATIDATTDGGDGSETDAGEEEMDDMTDAELDAKMAEGSLRR